jgi:hypothetical protein
MHRRSALVRAVSRTQRGTGGKGVLDVRRIGSTRGRNEGGTGALLCTLSSAERSWNGSACPARARAVEHTGLSLALPVKAAVACRQDCVTREARQEEHLLDHYELTCDT